MLECQYIVINYFGFQALAPTLLVFVAVSNKNTGKQLLGSMAANKIPPASPPRGFQQHRSLSNNPT